jgi:hypothetical protein
VSIIEVRGGDEGADQLRAHPHSDHGLPEFLAQLLLVVRSIARQFVDLQTRVWRWNAILV